MSSAPTAFSVQDQRRTFSAFRDKMTARSMTVFVVDYALLAGLLGAGLWLPSPWLKVLAGIVTGLVVGQLFVIGHDACHGSFSNSRRLNRVVGTLAFLPSLTPFSTWELGHNRIHHVYTNLKPRDYIWAPFSKAEYDALPAWRRALERFYRTPLGHGLNYFIEIWGKHLIFPRRAHVGTPKRIYVVDSLLVIAAACAVAAVTALAAHATGQSVVLVVVCSMVVPFVEFNAIIGFLIYQHHTSPTVRWYATEAEWRASHSQLDAVQHVIFPGLLKVLFQNIMEHHAHHLDPSLSLHQIGPAQAALEAALGSRVRIARWSVRTFVHASRVCKLYDYDAHRWCAFDGTHTTEPISGA
jgi:omega-6 fatty acid desaturase (delta-12 desaturase)